MGRSEKVFSLPLVRASGAKWERPREEKPEGLLRIKKVKFPQKTLGHFSGAIYPILIANFGWKLTPFLWRRKAVKSNALRALGKVAFYEHKVSAARKLQRSTACKMPPAKCMSWDCPNLALIAPILSWSLQSSSVALIAGTECITAGPNYWWLCFFTALRVLTSTLPSAPST